MKLCDKNCGKTDISGFPEEIGSLIEITRFGTDSFIVEISSESGDDRMQAVLTKEDCLALGTLLLSFANQ